jgi:hypothetical protein
MQKSFTAFASTEENLKGLIQHIDSERLREERVPACSFLSKNCLGMCCSLPVAVTQEETEVLTKTVKDKSVIFMKMAKSIPGPVIKFNAKTKRSYLAKRYRDFRQMNKIVYNLMNKERKRLPLGFKFFLNFIRSCVFTLDDGSCALQVLAEQEGLHKWYYKPFNCWKYPLSIDKGHLTLPEKIGSLHFPCSQDKSIFAYQGLKEELSFLGEIINRDILKEIWFT